MPTLMLSTVVDSGPLVLGWGLPGGGEWIVLLVLGLLIFGRRLPEVGRSLGRGIVEFKKGIRGIEEEIDDEVDRPAAKQVSSAGRQELPPRKTQPREQMDSDDDDGRAYAAAEQPRREATE